MVAARSPSRTRPSRRDSRLLRDVALLRSKLGPSPPTGRVLVLVCGLPGAGKSYFSQALARRAPVVVVESDTMRETLVARPTYTAAENERLFSAVHRLINELLRADAAVVLDATSRFARQRAEIRDLARRAGADVLTVWLTAPEPLIKERLARRASSAEWDVYQRMRDTAEPPTEPHLLVDSSKDIEPALNALAGKVAAGHKEQQWT